MGGQLTLMDAVGGYQQGVAWKQHQDDITRSKKQRDDVDAANKAGAMVLERYASSAADELRAPLSAVQGMPAQPAPAGPAPAAPAGPGAVDAGAVSAPIGDGGAAGGATAFPVAPTLAEAGPAGPAPAAPAEPAAPMPAAPMPQSAAPAAAVAQPPGAAPAVVPPVAGGAPARQRGYSPRPEHLLEAFDARGQVFAKNGDWKGWTENFAQAAGLRTQIRNKAIDAAIGGLDPKAITQDQAIALAQQLDPLVNDGKTITGATKNADGTITISKNDGTSSSMPPSNIYLAAQRMRMDPAKVAEMEYQASLADAKEAAKTRGAIKVETVKAGFKAVEQDQKHKNDLGLATVNNTAAGERTRTAAGATLGAARIRADATVSAANTGAKGEKDGLAVAQKWQDMAKTHFGKVAGGLMGGSRVAGQATLDLAATAQRIHDANKGRLSETQALDEAAKFLKLKSPAVGLDSLDDN